MPAWDRSFKTSLTTRNMLRVQADHWFVNDKNIGIMQQSGSDSNALAGAMRKPFDRQIHGGFQVESDDELGRIALNAFLWHLEELGREAKEFPGSELVVEKRKSGTKARRFRASSGWVCKSNPATRALPEVGFINPARIFKVVVLPAALGPSIAKNSPLGTLRLRSTTATRE